MVPQKIGVVLVPIERSYVVTKEQIQEYICHDTIKSYYKNLSPGVQAATEQLTARYREVFELYGVSPEAGAYIAAYALTGVIVNSCTALETGHIDQISSIVTAVLTGDVLMCLAPYL